MDIPEFFWAHRLKPINYYRYASLVVDPFFEAECTDTESTVVRRFNALKKMCMDTYLETNMDGLDYQKEVWDNKVVIECQTENGNTIYVGFYDLKLSIGLGVKTDPWVKPWAYRSKPLD